MSAALPIALECAARLHMMELSKRGGPTDEEIEQVREVGQLITEKGDVLQFGSKQRGMAAHILNKMAFAVAVMSFSPGGVTVFGIKFETGNFRG